MSRTGNVTATFSEVMSAASVTSSTVTLNVTGGTTFVTAVVTLNSTGRTAILNPSRQLAPNTQYTVNLTSGMRDVAGNPLAPVTWRFTTRA